MAADWYCRIAGAELGPLSSQQLRALATDGRLRADDEVCQGKGGKWVQANRVKGLLTSSSSEVLVARPLDEESEPGAAKPAKSRSKPVAGGAVPKAKTAPQPPEAPRTAVPVAKVAVAGSAPAAAAPAQSPFIFTEPGAEQGKSSTGKSGPLSPADVAKHRQKQRKRLLIGSIGAVGGVLVLLVVVWLAYPLLTGSGDETAQGSSSEEPVEEGELGSDLDTGLDDLLGEGERRTEGPADAGADGQRWLDASKDSAKAGAVNVRVVSVQIGKPRLKSATGQSKLPKEDLLIVTLELTNTDPAKKVVHSGWAGRAAAAHEVSLVDNHGNPYKSKSFTGAMIDGQQSDTSLYADEPVLDVLVFERPVDAAKHLRLTLPASAVNHEGMLRFEIPKNMIGAEPADVVADSPRAAGGRPAQAADAGDEGGEVHQLEVTEKAVQQAIGGMEAGEPERPLSDFDKLKRDNPGLFPEQ
ncbi:MAG: DUF4339 domain-containing protein [Thermoguttaceae bacterium]|jgi:hypothetical protein|nr:DUF4339 domain-containing protein [Thermoguttaceae bacterium]